MACGTEGDNIDAGCIGYELSKGGARGCVVCCIIWAAAAAFPDMPTKSARGEV
jgi:hypothetical protein